jgi:circadian clock protein KaiB
VTEPPGQGTRPPAQHRFKLYVAGQTPRSTRAIVNLRQMCAEAFPGGCEIVVVDVLEQPELAEQDHVLVTPTLIKEVPPPARRVLGDLSDTKQVLWGLQIAMPARPVGNQGDSP